MASKTMASRSKKEESSNQPVPVQLQMDLGHLEVDSFDNQKAKSTTKEEDSVPSTIPVPTRVASSEARTTARVLNSFIWNGEDYIRVIPAKPLFRSTMVHEVVNRGDVFALHLNSGRLTIVPGTALVEHVKALVLIS